VSGPLPDLPDLLRPLEGRRPNWVRVLAIVGGSVCLLLGVVAWLVPFVTGIPFIVAGLVLVGISSPQALGWINRVERTLPRGWRHALRRLLSKVPIEKLRRRIRQPGERD
jgi:hypothetical protein